MGYALFAQRKLMLTGLLNGLQLQQTQRSNEQLALATNTLSLQQQLTSLQTAQSQELAAKYEELANSSLDDFMPSGTDTAALTDAYNSFNAAANTKLSDLNQQLAAAKTAAGKNYPELGTYKKWLTKEGNSTIYTSPFTGFRYKAGGGENNFGYDGTDKSWNDKALPGIIAINNDLEANSPNHTDGDEEWSQKNIDAFNARRNAAINSDPTVQSIQNEINKVNSDKARNQQTYSASLSQAQTQKEEDTEKAEEKAKERREQIQWEIKQLEMKFKQEEDVINRQIYQVSIKENAIEMEVKRLDTKITAIQKQLEAVEEAEGAGIDRATPKFNGIG